MKLHQLAPFALALGGLALAGPGAYAQDAPERHVPLRKTIGQVTPTGPVPSLFVLNAAGAALADGKLTLTGVAANSIVFADRPVRAAGHVMTAQFLEQWDEGKDNFAIDPPNATVSVLGGVGSDISDAVVTLTNPVLDGGTLTFDVAVLEGALVGEGPAAIFIDDRGGRGGGGGGGFRGGSADFSGPRGGSADFSHEAGGEARGGNYYHQPDYHGGWYGAGDVAAGVAAGAVAGAAVGRAEDDDYPPCGYPPYPPCN